MFNTHVEMISTGREYVNTKFNKSQAGLTIERAQAHFGAVMAEEQPMLTAALVAGGANLW